MRPALLLLPLVAALAQEPEVIQSRVTLVPVTLSITDKNGQPVTDVKASELKLLDNGRERQVSFSQDFNSPLIVGLIADISGSQFEFYNQHADALKQFAGQVLRPNDRGFLVSVGRLGDTDVQMVRDLTGSVETLRTGVEILRTFGQPTPQFGDRCVTVKCRGTALWNSVYSAAELRMRLFTGRKAMIILSDGVDSGSQHTLDQAIASAQGFDTPVYTIHTANFGGPAFFSASAKANAQGKRDLRKLSAGTGGRAYDNPEGDLPKVFAQIENELRNLYILSFVLPESERDNKFHKLEVKVSRKDVRVRARDGYTAK
jgi:VWFA-related protein